MIRIAKKPYIYSKKGNISIDKRISENDILRKLIKDQLKLSDKEISTFIKKEREILLPISIFNNKLSTLEIVVKYLKEKEILNITQISELLNRDNRTIWQAYNFAISKKISLEIKHSEIRIPVSIFSDRKFSPLESLVEYLHNQGLTFTEIADKLSLNPKTIWTVNSRVKIKRRSDERS